MKKAILGSIFLYTLAFSGDYINSIGMKFKEIPSGTFMMGSAIPNCPKDNPFTEKNEFDECLGSISKYEIPQYKVILESFYMQESEVTQGQWYEIMGSNPSSFKRGDPNMPVEQVSWNDAQKFINKLNAKEGNKKYRLPTEEEWEYAARAGTITKWYCGDSESCVNSIAVYTTSSQNSPKPVKSKKPNAWGLYDMSGNVWEWTQSCWSIDYNSEKNCEKKVLRGGGWNENASNTRSAVRGGDIPDYRYFTRGFRLLADK